ncbi:Cox family DNA-binding protein [Escherichia coli]
MSIGSEMNNDVGEKVSDLTKSKKCDIKLAAAPSDLLSKEGFALYIGKTPRAVAEMAKAGKLPAFYMTDPLKPGGHAELWIILHVRRFHNTCGGTAWLIHSARQS